MSITINTSSREGYRERTIENAESCPVTIAFATNFDTAGEKLTRRSVEQAGKIYIPVQLNPLDIREWSEASKAADTIINGLKPIDDWGKVSINIAGNGMYSFPSFVHQEHLDVFMMRTLMLVESRSDLEIRRVRSGGQTGIDEAGVKAADMLGIAAEVNGPGDYKFRIRLGNGYRDIRGKEQFERRFSLEHNRRRHLEPLAELNRQIHLLPVESRQALFRGESVQLPSGAMVEIAENSEGQDRLWCGDDLFDEAVHLRQEERKQVHSFYYRFKVDYCEYMSDTMKSREVFADSVTEAGRIVESEQVTDLIHGSYPPEIYSIQADALVVDGNFYSVDPAELQHVTDMVSYCSHLIHDRRPDAINIWHSSGENADLSNFAIRPFDFRTGENDYIRFQSVEQGFQYMKTLGQFSDCPDDVRAKIQETILSITDGGKLRELGRAVPGLNVQLWNRNRERIMHDMIWSSFDENPAAKERLMATGDIKLVHHQDGSHWRYTFPKLLKRVRHDFIRRRLIRDSYNSLCAEVGGAKVHFYEGKIEPHKDVVFVFGSNYEGRHGAGAAKVAREQFGAIYGQAEGLQGNSYGIPTKDLRVKENNGYRSVSKEDIIDSIRAMYRSAEANFTKTYMVAYTNPPEKRSLSGYSGGEMIEMFVKAGPIPCNVQFSSVWKEEMTRQLKMGTIQVRR